MCHLKLEMLLHKTGYKPKEKQKRFKVFLTNSLEEAHPFTGSMFATWLSKEASKANYIKRDLPVMVVLGNPPYKKHSVNKNDWILNLLNDYKKEPTGEKLQERNSKWLNDDYVKFIRFGEELISKNKNGILAFITNNGYLINTTFRGMRYKLLNTFNKIYIIDLHGNSNIKEKTPNGTNDENVFDIQQGVSILLAVKINNSKRLSKVFSVDVYGKRDYKYDWLWNNDLSKIDFEEIDLKPPYYIFKNNFNEAIRQIYNKGFSLSDLFIELSTGYYTSRDNLVLGNSKKEVQNQIINFLVNNNIPEILKEYSIKEKSNWKINDIKKHKFKSKYIHKTLFRPFDEKYLYYSDDFLERSRRKFIAKFLGKENFVLITAKNTKNKEISHAFITKYFSELKCGESTIGSYMFPLYLYSRTNNKHNVVGTETRTPNLKKETIAKISEFLGLIYVPEKNETENTFSPVDILNYIYAILHSPLFRKKYKEFLKIEFPRIPYPKNKNIFWQLVKLGKEIRQIHLLESPIVEKYITSYPKEGDNKITRKIGKNDFEIIDQEKNLGRLWINDQQYFDGIPIIAWEFYIGGYQPAQKWLKDRRGRELNFEDILHYQKIIVALKETDRIMKEIDKIKFID